MSRIDRYVLVDENDQSEDFEYDTLDEARAAASKRDEPMAVMARIYLYDDSELVWTSTGDTVWPPQPEDETMSESDEKTYRIVRFFQDDRPRQTIEEGLTLDEAQEHCNREDTHGDGWFDGYYEED